METPITPIPAKCRKCGYDWIDAVRPPCANVIRLFPHLRNDPPRMVRDAIRAPSLEMCRCFWCGGRLKPHPDYQPAKQPKATPDHDRQPALFD